MKKNTLTHIRSDSRLRTAKDKTILRSLIDFSLPYTPFVPLIFKFFLTCLIFSTITSFLLASCPSFLSYLLLMILGYINKTDLTFQISLHPSITFMLLLFCFSVNSFNTCVCDWYILLQYMLCGLHTLALSFLPFLPIVKLRHDKESSSFAISIGNHALTETQTCSPRPTDKQRGGGSYLGLIWRRCPCPAGFCGNTKGKVVRNTHTFIIQMWQWMHLNTQTIYVLCWPWAGTLPSHSVYSIPVKFLPEAWKYKKYLKYWKYHKALATMLRLVRCWCS